MWKYFILLLCLLKVVPQVGSLYCFKQVPDSPSNRDNCNTIKENPDYQLFKDANFSSPSCYKIIVKTFLNQTIVKGCMPGNGCNVTWGHTKNNPENDIGEKLLKQLFDVECYECKTDWCNSTSRFVTFNLLGIFLTSITLILNYFFN